MLLTVHECSRIALKALAENHVEENRLGGKYMTLK